MSFYDFLADSENPTPPPHKGKFADAILQAASEAKIDPDILAQLVHHESTGNPNATSPVGAQGLTQLMPKTAEIYGVKDRLNPQENLRGGASYLADLYSQFGDWGLALAAYNAGPARVRSRLQSGQGLPTETLQYMEKFRLPQR